ncbi:MAG TPA: hypothetical protein PKC28_01250 [Bdellovibrionales bacterium]|nr:hypothetical protein [Bdellovibrionales bacterium]
MLRKKEMVSAFIAQLESDLRTMIQAARDAHEAATNEESQPENEYDTRGLEASYLAGAQAKRAAEIDEVLSLFKNTPFKDFREGDPIQATALIDLKIDGKDNQVLLMPKGGGVRIQYQGHPIQIVTPQSNLGRALVGLKAGDTTEFEVGPALRECEVLTVR